MSTSRTGAAWIGILIPVALLFLLNALLAAYLWFPTANPIAALIPIPESIAFLALFWLVSTRVPEGRWRVTATIVTGSIFGVYLGFSIAEAFFQFYFARPFMPAGDIGMIRGALLLFFGDIGPLATALTPVVIVLLFALLMAAGSGLAFLLGRLFRRGNVRLWSVVPVAVAGILVLAIAGVPRSLSGRVVLGWFEGPDQFVPVVVPENDQSTVSSLGTDAAPEAEGEPSVTYVFPGILDRDIYVFVVEAYGYASTHRPELAEQIAPHRDRFAEALAAQGYSVASSFLESPVAGGYSWLAEATLLSGQLVNSQERFLSMVEAKLPTLTGMLHDGGYYTFTVRPGTVHASWPEAWDVYRFEESIVAYDGDFGFVGPWFSYVPVTDQYSIWTGDRRINELTAPGGPAEDQPLLAYYQLVSSHTPFNAIPPMIEPWDDLGDGSVYNEREDEIQRFANTWTGGSELEEGYVAAIGYVFDVLTDYVDTIMDHSRDPIIIVLGDHQPQRPIRSANNYKSVPIHVASRDDAVFANFVSHGFEPGIVSSAPPPHLHMKDFFAFFADLAATPFAAE
jgi:hypothetical protein